MSFVKLKCRVCGNSFMGKTRNMLLRELEPGRCHPCVKVAAKRQGMIFFKRSVKRAITERKLIAKAMEVFMKKTITVILIALGLIVTVPAVAADELTTHFLLGKDNVGYKSLGATYSKPLFNVFSGYAGVDIMMDKDVFSNPFFSGELGALAQVKTSIGLYLKVAVGAAVVSSTPKGLASHFQIVNTIGGGLYNEIGGIGFIYKHYSNGTSSWQNTGRDYIGFEVTHGF